MKKLLPEEGGLSDQTSDSDHQRVYPPFRGVSNKEMGNVRGDKENLASPFCIKSAVFLVT